MKINWGTGLVIGMLLFMAFILYMVVTMSTNKKFSHDLVTEGYYQKEMVYQEEIDAEQNTYGLNEVIEGKKTENGWILNFPKDLEHQNIRGTIFLYRPSDKHLDFDFPIQFSGSSVLIPDLYLLEGRWNITVDWSYEGKKYLYKKEIVY